MSENTAKRPGAKKPLRDMFPFPGKEDWRGAAEKLLKGKPFDKIMKTRLYEDILLEPLYWRDDISSVPPFPGFPPFTRDRYPSGKINGKHYVAQETAQREAGEANKAILNGLKAGQNAVNLRLDTDLGNFSFPRGVKINEYGDLKTVLEGVDLNSYPLFFSANSRGKELYEFLDRITAEKGISMKEIKGSLNFDPLVALISAGVSPESLEKHLNEMSEVIRKSAADKTDFRVTGISADLFSDSGANAVQELAFALAWAVYYLREMQNRKIEVDLYAPKIQFNFGIGANFFVEIAKIRAARYLWTKVIEAFDGKPENSGINIHARTTTINKTALDPYVNMLRTTTEAFSAMIAGVDSLHVVPFDAVTGGADGFAERIARNQQIIIYEEVHLDKITDPAGGSWYIEWLTDELIDKSWTLFQAVEEKGGFIEALKNEFIQREIENTQRQRIKDIRKRKKVLVGTNMFPNLKEEVYETEGKNVSAAEKRVKDDRPEQKIKPLKPLRLSEIFEELRGAVKKAYDEGRRIPAVYLLHLGEIHQYKARADFAREYFEPAGIEVVYPSAEKNFEAMMKETEDKKISACVICGSDTLYAERAEEAARKIKEQRPDVYLYLAGRPGEMEDRYRSAGIDDFIYMGKDVYADLLTLLRKGGVAK
jgi:methylmalonyl-CoA mutase